MQQRRIFLLPPMEMTGQRLAATRQAVGVQVPAVFPASKVNVTIPANTKATILLDQGYLTNAYPTLVFSGGQRATVSMGYAEALYTLGGRYKLGFINC